MSTYLTQLRLKLHEETPVAETRQIPPSDLLIDPQNPRLAQASKGQREAQREIAALQGKKLLVLAKSILKHGMNPSKLPIVAPVENDDLKRYVVLEGNRRLTALRALENPEWLMGTVDVGVLTGMRELSKEYQKNPIEYVQCVIIADQEEARRWIALEHTGENEGEGVVKWGSQESNRFSARTKGLNIASQALSLLEGATLLTPADRSKVPATSLKRLLSTPEVRAKVGLDLEDGQLVFRADESAVAKALFWVAKELSSGRTKVKDIYTADQRKAFAEAIPASVAVKPAAAGRRASPSTAPAATPARPRSRPKSRGPREVLIPRDCVLDVADNRVAAIEDELRRLNIENFTNAVSVLSRVFLELTVDDYIKACGLGVDKRAKLRAKLQEVVNDLVTRAKLDKEQARPIRTALQKDSFLAPSIDMMNDYVHTASVFPAPSDLRANWDTLQPFFVAVWSR